MQDLLSIGTNRRESMIGTGIGLGLAGYRLNPPGVLPVLDLRFSQDKSLTAFAGPTPSFSRASSGTYFDANGVLQSAGVNAARFNHVFNGTSWVSRGLLVEEQRTNSISYSNNFSTGFTLGSAQLASGAINSPDGTTNGWKLYESASGSGSVDQRRYGNYTITGQNTISFYAKAAERRRVLLFANGPNQGAWFDLISGTAGNDSNWTGATQSIQNVGNGWYRCVMTTGVQATTIQVQILLDGQTTNTGNRLGDGVSGVYIAHIQGESGAFATSLISTNGSTATRSADVCQITGTDFSGFWNGTEGSLAIDCDRLFVGTADNWLYKFNASAGVDNINHQFYNGNDYSRVFYSGAPSAIDYGASSSSGVITKFSGGFSSSGYVGIKNGIIADTKAITTIGTGHNELIIGNGGTSASPANFWNGHIARLRYYRTRLENGTLRVLST